MIDNEWGFKCTWCGEEVDEVKEPDLHARNVVGICDEDGIVYVTPDGESP